MHSGSRTPTSASNGDLPPRRRLGPEARCLVAVDVLSFTTAVSICVSRGMTVFPHRWDLVAAEAFAVAHDAELAVRRREVAVDHPWSLSPAVLSTAPVTPRLVLPSPNGSTISAAAADAGALVIAACLRNAGAVGRWLVAGGYGSPGRPVRGGGRRGAMARRLVAPRPRGRPRCGSGAPSPEDGRMPLVGGGQPSRRGCSRPPGTWKPPSGRAARPTSSVNAGYGGDVDVAAQLDADPAVPVLHHGAFSSS